MRLVLTALVAGSLLAVAPPAQASFPGENGPLVYWGSGNAQIRVISRTFVHTVDPSFPMFGVTLAAGNAEYQCYGKRTPCTAAGAAPSPDGRTVIVDRSFAPADAVEFHTQAIVNAFDGSVVRTLPGESAHPSEAAWSPDGKAIVVARAGDAVTAGLYVVDPVSGTETRLTTGGGTQPDWSTGGWIAFVRDGALWRIRPDGSGLTALGAGADPSWSADGGWLAFSRAGEVYVARADGNAPRRVVTGRAPAWSPDGRRLAFIRGAGGSIQTVRLDGSGRRTLVGRPLEGGLLGVAWLPRVTQVPRRLAIAGPRLIGRPRWTDRGVAWLERSPGAPSTGYVLRAEIDGTATTVVNRQSRRALELRTNGRFYGVSESRPDGGHDLLSGDLPGAGAELVSCPAGTAPVPFDMNGGRMAYVNPCSEGGGRVHIRELSTGVESMVDLPAGNAARRVALAGRILAVAR